ncbi:MAG: AAA family ATPase [bacterium]
MSRKKVLIVGGIHGVGKSTLCAELARKDNALIIRQRHVLIEIGKELGLDWEEIGPLHSKFIAKVADIITCRISDDDCRLAAIDCHYAIRTGKALRAKHVEVLEPYIPDLDPIVLSRAAEVHDVRMLLLKASPEICAERIKVGSPDHRDFDLLLDGLRLMEVAEALFFERLLSQHASVIGGALILQNDASLQELYTKVCAFLD